MDITLSVVAWIDAEDPGHMYITQLLIITIYINLLVI